MYRTGSAQGVKGGGGGKESTLFYGRCRENLIIVTVNRCNRPPVILVSLRPASLTHKNPQRRKIFHGTRPAGRKDRSIDLNMCICRNIRPVGVISVQLLWLLFNDSYLF